MNEKIQPPMNSSSDAAETHYNITNWIKYFKNFEDYKLPNPISREHVSECYKQYYSGEKKEYDDLTKAFLATMVWGYGDGYGPYRTKQIMASADFENKLKEALEILREKEESALENAFGKLKSIPSLGVSFFTKILYFAAKALENPIEHQPLIFDTMVCRELINRQNNSGMEDFRLSDIMEIYPSSEWKHYRAYLSWMHNTSHEEGKTPEALEMELFAGGRKI